MERLFNNVFIFSLFCCNWANNERPDNAEKTKYCRYQMLKTTEKTDEVRKLWRQQTVAEQIRYDQGDPYTWDV